MKEVRTMPVHAAASLNKQRGSSVIELPIIALILMVLVVFSVKIGHGVSLKAKLDQLAYSLTSVVASERLEFDLSGTGDVITAQIAEALHVVAERHIQSGKASSSIEVGILLEQLKQDSTGAHHFAEQAGPGCQARQTLTQLAALAPIGGGSAVSGQKPDLFQVSVCLSSVPSLAGAVYPVFIRDFAEHYFNSSAVLIGRQYD